MFIYTVSVARFIELCLGRHYSAELGHYFTVFYLPWYVMSGWQSVNLLSNEYMCDDDDDAILAEEQKSNDTKNI